MPWQTAYSLHTSDGQNRPVARSEVSHGNVTSVHCATLRGIPHHVLERTGAVFKSRYFTFKEFSEKI